MAGKGVRSILTPSQKHVPKRIPMSASPAVASSPVDAILQQIQSRLGPTQSREAQVFASHFFRRVSADDIAARPLDQWVGLVLGLLDFVRVRKPGTPSIRVFN